MERTKAWSAAVVDEIERFLIGNVSDEESEWILHSFDMSENEVRIAVPRCGSGQKFAFRVSRPTIERYPYQLKANDVRMVAFYIVHTAVLEPHSEADFGSPDETGWRWLDGEEWVRNL